MYILSIPLSFRIAMNKISGISLEDLGNVGSFEDEFKPMEIEELTDITKSPAKEELLRRMDKYCASFEYRFDEKAMNVKIASIIILVCISVSLT